MNYIISNGELYHHGVKGMHWGVRRYQNADGSLKPAGRKRYTEGGTGSAKTSKGGKKQLTDEERTARNAKIKKAAIAVGAVAATAALAYVGHKYVNKKMNAAEKMVVDIGRKNVDRAFSQWQLLNDNSAITKSRGDKLYDEGRKTEAKAYWDAARESKETAKRQMERYSNLYDSYNKAVGDRKTNARVALATAKRDRALRELDKSGKSVSRDQLDAIIAQYEHDVMDAIKKAK